MIYSYGTECSSTTGHLDHDHDHDHDHDDDHDTVSNLYTDYAIGTGKWGPSGTLGTSGGTVTWSLAGSGLANATGHSFFTGSTVSFNSITNFDYTAIITQVFDAWSAVANIDFQQVTDGGGHIGVGSSANIRIAAGYIDGASSVLARAYLPTYGGTSQQSATSGDVVMDSGESWDSNLFFLTMLHEVGHSLGLEHSASTTAIMYPYINTNLTGLSADDIAGIRALYGERNAIDDVGGTVQTASTIGANESKTGNIEVGADEDWYALNVVSGTTYTIELKGSGSSSGTLSDPILAVYSASGSTLAYNDDNPASISSLESYLQYTPTFTGTVYVSAQSFLSNTGTYTLSVASLVGPTAGDDQLSGTSGDDAISLLDGNDIYHGYGGNDTVYGNGGNDQLFGGGGSDTLYGNDGDDLISGGGGNDILYGGNGADTMLGNSGNDIFYGQNGSDIISGYGGRDSIFGGDGADVINANAGNDVIYGNDGDDIIQGANGRDVILGGAGQNTLAGGLDNDTIVGGDDVDVINGGGGSDLLLGYDGNDMISGAFGRDRLFGGLGDDWLSGGGNDGQVDTFWFENSNGIDRVVDFENGIDLIGFSSHSVITQFSDVLSHAQSSGSGGGSTRITIDANNTITLVNFALSDLSADDFIF